jgi:predicted AlkP superfamily phosphohydrolase/phosphomutase
VAKPRVLLIGLDGATLDLITPWAAAGDLPNLARLMRTGAWGRLRSTTPAMTFPAWSTMMTGVDPGRHGVFDFTRRPPGPRGRRRAVEFVNATHRRFPSLWRRLSRAGRTLVLLGLPATYPPEPISGVMIAGFDAPVATAIDASFVHPPQVYAELRRAVGEYRFADFQQQNIGPDWHAQVLEKMQAALSDRTAVAGYLLTRKPWDCAMVLFGESDAVGHHFWIFHDPASPRFDAARARQLGGAIRAIYRQLDEAVGRLTALAPEATVIVLSDHGFGGTGATVLHLNRWLADEGYLKFTAGQDWLGRGLRAAKGLGLRWLPRRVQEQVFRRGGGRLANRLESGARFRGIDWARTRAFSEEVNTCPAIWLNVAGRDEAGVVPAGDYAALRAELIARLEAWRNPATGERIVARAWRREELYHGPHVVDAPDILLELALENGYAYTCLSSQGRAGPAVRTLTPAERVGAKGGSMNGSHRPDGVLIMAGPGVRAAGEIAGAHLRDVAPTVLALLGEPVPADLDGRVLAGALCQPPGQPAADDVSLAWAPGPVQAYSPQEAAVVAERLRGLGYLE